MLTWKVEFFNQSPLYIYIHVCNFSIWSLSCKFYCRVEPILLALWSCLLLLGLCSIKKRCFQCIFSKWVVCKGFGWWYQSHFHHKDVSKRYCHFVPMGVLWVWRWFFLLKWKEVSLKIILSISLRKWVGFGSLYVLHTTEILSSCGMLV